MDSPGYSRAHKTEPAAAPATAADDFTSQNRRAAAVRCRCSLASGTSLSKFSTMMALFYCLCVAVLLLLSLPGPASARTTAYAGWDYAPGAAAEGERSRAAKKSAASDWRAAHAQYAAEEDQDRYSAPRPTSSPYHRDANVGYGSTYTASSTFEGISTSLRRLVLDGLAQAHGMIFGQPQRRATTGMYDNNAPVCSEMCM